MKSCGVERHPPRLPTVITRALVQCSSTAGLTRSSISTTSAACRARTAFRVSNSGSPGPAPPSHTFALMLFPLHTDGDWLRVAGQKTFDFRHAGATLGAAAQGLFEAIQVQAAAD